MAKKVLTLTALREEHAELIKEYNAHIGNPNSNEAEKLALNAKIADCEAEYAHRKMLAIYDEVETAVDPVRALITRNEFYALTHKAKKEKVKMNGIEVEVLKGYEVVDDTKGDKKGKRYRLELEDFCKRTERPLGFRYRVVQLNELLFIWGSKQIHKTDEQILKKNDSDFVKKTLAKLNEHMKQATTDDGRYDPTRAQVPSPISNKSLVAKLQQAFDVVPTVSTLTAKPEEMSAMIGGLKQLYTVEGRGMLEIVMRTNDAFMRIFQKAVYAAVTNQSFEFADFTIERYSKNGGAIGEKTEGNSDKEKTEKADAEETENK